MAFTVPLIKERYDLVTNRLQGVSGHDTGQVPIQQRLAGNGIIKLRRSASANVHISTTHKRPNCSYGSSNQLGKRTLSLLSQPTYQAQPPAPPLSPYRAGPKSILASPTTSPRSSPPPSTLPMIPEGLAGPMSPSNAEVLEPACSSPTSDSGGSVSDESSMPSHLRQRSNSLPQSPKHVTFAPMARQYSINVKKPPIYREKKHTSSPQQIQHNSQKCSDDNNDTKAKDRKEDNLQQTTTNTDESYCFSEDDLNLMDGIKDEESTMLHAENHVKSSSSSAGPNDSSNTTTPTRLAKLRNAFLRLGSIDEQQ